MFAVLTGVILGGIVLIFKDGKLCNNQEAINYGVQRIEWYLYNLLFMWNNGCLCRGNAWIRIFRSSNDSFHYGCLCI